MRVAEWKIREVEKIKELIKSHRVIGVARLSGIPARKMQEIRRELRGKAKIRVSRKTLMRLALRECEKNGKSGISKLENFLDGECSLIFTEMNPLELNSYLESKKSRAPAKPGSIMPADVIIPEGETNLPPGPVVTDLKVMGVPADIKRGKVIITKESILAKKGEKISEKKAEIINALDLSPIVVGLELLAAYDDGVIFTKEVLGLRKEDFLEDLRTAFSRALNLSIGICYPTEHNIGHLLSSAFVKAKALAIEAGIITPEVIKELVASAYIKMLSLASKLPKDALDKELEEATSGITKKVDKKRKIERKEKEEEKEEKEEKEEEEAMEVLAALFG